jgi:hypothetical protein
MTVESIAAAEALRVIAAVFPLLDSPVFGRIFRSPGRLELPVYNERNNLKRSIF